jgi:hypothetical protein
MAMSGRDSLLAEISSGATAIAFSDNERRFKFRGTHQAVGVARRALREWERTLEPHLFYDLSLCVSELVSSRVRGGENAENDEIELTVWRSEEMVRAETRAASGERDMFIVDRVADRWGVDRGEGTLTWCELDLAPAKGSLGGAAG